MRLTRELLPLAALALGLVSRAWLSPLTGLIPWAIAAMLFLTFLGVAPSALRPRWAHLWLTVVELLLIALGLAVHAVCPTVGVGAVLLLMTPTATAAPSIVHLLGGNVGFVAGAMILAHGRAVLLTPLLLPLISPETTGSLSFASQATEVLASIAPLVLVPIALAWGLRWGCPTWAGRLSAYKQLPYLIWLSSLVLLMTRTAQLLVDYAEAWAWGDLVLYLAIGLAVCALEFALGHVLAPRLGVERHAARQSLAQKNTTLALWLATLYLPPLSATAAASYILWQNIAITFLMLRRSRSEVSAS